MANIKELIDEQACRMRGRAVKFDGTHSPEDTDIHDLIERANINLSSGYRAWRRGDDDKAITDFTDVCNLLAVAIDKIAKGER